MAERLKKLYRAVNQQYPLIGSLMRRIRFQKPFDQVRKKIKGKENLINHQGSMLSSVVFDVVGNGNKIEIKSACILDSVTFHIRGNHHSISIGEGCRFNQGAVIWFEDSDGSLEIGDKSTFENVHLAVTEPGSAIKIGRDCMFAHNIDIRTGDSHSIIDLQSNERINYAKDICIGDHVWIAARCTILKGVCIPAHSVVGTGSIVTKQFFQPETIIAGNPARVVKEGISWSRERTYKVNQQAVVAEDHAVLVAQKVVG